MPTPRPLPRSPSPPPGTSASAAARPPSESSPLSASTTRHAWSPTLRRFRFELTLALLAAAATFQAAWAFLILLPLQAQHLTALGGTPRGVLWLSQALSPAAVLLVPTVAVALVTALRALAHGLRRLDAGPRRRLARAYLWLPLAATLALASGTRGVLLAASAGSVQRRADLRSLWRLTDTSSPPSWIQGPAS